MEIPAEYVPVSLNGSAWVTMTVSQWLTLVWWCVCVGWWCSASQLVTWYNSINGIQRRDSEFVLRVPFTNDDGTGNSGLPSTRPEIKHQPHTSLPDRNNGSCCPLCVTRLYNYLFYINFLCAQTHTQARDNSLTKTWDSIFYVTVWPGLNYFH